MTDTEKPTPELLPDGTPVPVDALGALDVLPQRKRGFVLLYFAGEEGVKGNGTKAAIAAGYSKKSAAAMASVMLKEPKVKAALTALNKAATTEAIISHQKFLELALEQANAWKDPETGRPKESPLVSQGTIVVAEFVVRDRNGNIEWVTDPVTSERRPITVKQPVIEQWRPNSTNVQALITVGKACGWLQESRGFGAGDGAAPVVGDTPTGGYDQRAMPDAKLESFLDTLPSPADTGPRTGVAPLPAGAAPN